MGIIDGLLEGVLSAWPLYPVFGALVLAVGGLRTYERRRLRRRANLTVDVSPRHRQRR